MLPNALRLAGRFLPFSPRRRCCLALSARAQAVWPDADGAHGGAFAPAGGPTDVPARLLADTMSAALPHRIVVENRTGAGVVVGTDLVAKGPQDGSMLLYTTVAHAVTRALFPNLPSIRWPISRPARWSDGCRSSLLVARISRRRNVQELVRLLRENPGRYDYASSGNGGAVHLATELFLTAPAGCAPTTSRSDGSSQAIPELPGRPHPDDLRHRRPALPYVRSGELRALAISTRERSPLAPEIPDLRRTGHRRLRALHVAYGDGALRHAAGGGAGDQRGGERGACPAGSARAAGRPGDGGGWGSHPRIGGGVSAPRDRGVGTAGARGRIRPADPGAPAACARAVSAAARCLPGRRRACCRGGLGAGRSAASAPPPAAAVPGPKAAICFCLPCAALPMGGAGGTARREVPESRREATATASRAGQARLRPRPPCQRRAGAHAGQRWQEANSGTAGRKGRQAGSGIPRSEPRSARAAATRQRILKRRSPNSLPTGWRVRGWMRSQPCGGQQAHAVCLFRRQGGSLAGGARDGLRRQACRGTCPGGGRPAAGRGDGGAGALQPALTRRRIRNSWRC